METSASFEARSAPLPYPTAAGVLRSDAGAGQALSGHRAAPNSCRHRLPLDRICLSYLGYIHRGMVVGWHERAPMMAGANARSLRCQKRSSARPRENGPRQSCIGPIACRDTGISDGEHWNRWSAPFLMRRAARPSICWWWMQRNGGDQSRP